jgi:glyoxylase-like metal-dependent hydrolase (beta-lactamase superfamily II)
MKNFRVIAILPFWQPFFRLSSIVCAAICLLMTVPQQAAFAQAAQSRAQQNGAARNGDQSHNGDSAEIEVVHVQENVSMLAGAGGNITVQTGNDGILLVDTGSAAMSAKVMESLKKLSRGQVTYIVNTDDRSDHIGGNELFATSGQPLAIGRAAQANAMIIAFSTILDRMSTPTGQISAVPEKAWPNDTYSGPLKTLYFNGDGVEIHHMPGTTDGNSIVLFRHADVISTGDIFDITRYPIIDLKNGGSLQAVLDALNRLKVMAIPGDHQEGGTMIIPGHGRVCDEADLALYQEMVTIVRDRLQDMIKKGMTLEQIEAAKPTQDYDPIYGKNEGDWTTNMFIEAAYKSLSNKPNARGAE